MNLKWIMESGVPLDLKSSIEDDWTYAIPSNIASINPKALSAELVLRMDSLIDMPVDQRKQEMASIIKEYGTVSEDGDDQNKNNDEEIII